MVALEGIGREEIPEAPVELLGQIGLAIRNMGVHLSFGDYFRYTRVLHDNGEEEVVEAKDLLPEHMRKYYGYSGLHEAERLCCLNMATMHGDANLDGIETASARRIIEEHIAHLPQGESPRKGDYMCVVRHRPQPDGSVNHVSIHVAVVESPGLVWSKNGGGRDVPFLLQPVDSVVDYFGHLDPKSNVWDTIEYARQV